MKCTSQKFRALIAVARGYLVYGEAPLHAHTASRVLTRGAAITVSPCDVLRLRGGRGVSDFQGS